MDGCNSNSAWWSLWLRLGAAVLLCLLALPVNAGASLASLSDAERDWLSQHPVIPIGVDGNWPPIDFMDRDGHHRGIAADYLGRLSRLLGVQFEVHPGPTFKQMLGRVMAGEQPLAASVVETPERAAKLWFTSPFFTVLKAIVARSDGDPYRRIEDLYGKVVAIEDGFSTMRQLQQHPQIRLKPVANTREALEAVSFGQADAYVGNRAVAQWLIRKQQLLNLHFTGDPGFGPAPQRFAVHRADEWAPLPGIIDKALAVIDADQRRLIESRWLGPANEPADTAGPLLNDAQRRWLAAHPNIRLGVDPAWPPFEFIDEQGRYRGLAAEFVDLFNQMLGTRMAPLPYQTWAEVMQAARQRQVDVLPAVLPTEQRREFLLFTKPYLSYPYMIFVNQDVRFQGGLDELAGRTVAIERGYAMHDVLARDHPRIQRVGYDNTEQALLAVQRHEVDAYVGNLSATLYALDKLGLRDIKIAAPTGYQFEQTLGVRKDWPELVAILNQAIDAITPAQRAEIKQRWFPVRFEQVIDRSELWRWVQIVVLVALLIILLMLYWNRRLQREIGARKQLQRQLEASKRSYHDAVGAVSESIWEWDARTDQRRFSPGLFLSLGYREDDIPGSEKQWRAMIHPADKLRRMETLAQQERDPHLRDRPWQIEYRVRRGDGGWAWVQLNGRVTGRDEHGRPVLRAGTARDITREKEAEGRIRQLTEAVEQSPSLVLLTDPSTRLEYANRRLKPLTGYDWAQVKGQPARLLLSANADGEQAARLEAAVAEHRGWSGELLLRRADGEDYWAAISISPVLNEVNELVHFVGIIEDISLRKQAERALAEAHEAADRANQFKSRFLANMSHEIRTPMNAIIGLGHLALQTNLDERQRDYLSKIQSSAQALLGIINDILDFSRIEAGQLRIEVAPFRLDEILLHLSDLVTLRAEEKGLEILFDVAGDVPQRLMGDSLRIGQVLINLTQNAIKFTEKGEVVVRIKTVAQQDQQVRLRFEVRDTGIGIARDRLPQLFDSFTQADDSTTRRFGGSGLGLSISRQLVELMQGEIGADSRIGDGSCFWFELPLALQPELEHKPWQHDLPADVRALVVDDNPVARNILADMLRSFRFNVDAVASGPAAIEAVREADSDPAQKAYDLLLMDWKMPTMNGFEAVRHIRMMRKLSKLPAMVIVTAYGREEVLRRAEASHVDGLLIKPVSPSLLFDTIMQALQRPGGNDTGLPGQRDVPRPGLEGEVLLVEDNAINRQVAREMLRGMGLSVAEADTGRAAIDRLTERDFDLVLMDIQMPDMDGLEATRLIRQMPRYRNLPIIAMTAHALDSDRERSLAAGMNEHISKPIDPARLYRVLQSYLPERATAAEIEPPHADDTHLPDWLPGIEVGWGLQRIGGNARLYRRLLQSFLEDHGDMPQEIANAWDRDDKPLARRLIHTLEGVSANLGATELAAAARDLSIAAKQNPSGFHAALAELHHLFAQVLNGLQEWLQSEQPSAGDTGEGGESAAVDELVARFASALAQGSPEAGELLVPLRRVLQTSQNSAEFDRLAELLEEYEFDAAQELFAQLQQPAAGQAANPGS